MDVWFSLGKKSTDMEHKKIIIDEDAYIRYINKDNYELHVRTWGPTGAWVYKFDRGNLKWKQRRSYAFLARPLKPLWFDKKDL